MFSRFRTWARHTIEIIAICAAACWIVMAQPGCAGGQVLPALEAADAIGRGVANVMGWCEANGADPGELLAAAQAAQRGDLQGAFALLDKIVAARGAPQEVRDLLTLAEGAYAAKAIQDSMRSISLPQDGGAG